MKSELIQMSNLQKYIVTFDGCTALLIKSTGVEKNTWAWWITKRVTPRMPSWYIQSEQSTLCKDISDLDELTILLYDIDLDMLRVALKADLE